MPLGKDQIQHIARLARLNLTASEIEKFSHDLAVVVDYFEQLQTVDTSGIEAQDQFVHAKNRLREDKVTASLPQKTALANAPDTDGRFFHVPKVIG